MAERVVRLKTGEQRLRSVVLSVELSVPEGKRGAVVIGETERPAQITPLPEGKAVVTWLEEELPPRTEKTYRLRFLDAPLPPLVCVRGEAKWVTVTVDGQLFTRYHFSEIPKPFCFPLIGPNGKPLTRGFPVDPRPGETTDHVHHRGFWVGYGDLNGHDFWAEEEGKIVHRAFEALESGPAFGRIRARNDWLTRDGKKLCEEVRELRFYAFPSVRVLDLIVTFLATETDIVFGDTKEGFVAIRLPDELTVRFGTGHILNATGYRDTEAWGKRASWCLYYGTLRGAPVAVAFFDHPRNIGYPNPWHVRDYGLFANGPFARRPFNLPPEEPVRILKGKSMTLRYRLILYGRTPTAPETDEAWAAFARPPQCQVLP